MLIHTITPLSKEIRYYRNTLFPLLLKIQERIRCRVFGKCATTTTTTTPCVVTSTLFDDRQFCSSCETQQYGVEKPNSCLYSRREPYITTYLGWPKKRERERRGDALLTKISNGLSFLFLFFILLASIFHLKYGVQYLRRVSLYSYWTYHNRKKNFDHYIYIIYFFCFLFYCMYILHENLHYEIQPINVLSESASQHMDRL